MGAYDMANLVIEEKVYYIKVDEQNFIKDVIQYNPGLEIYKRYEMETVVPYDVLWGYYQLIDGEFVINEEAKAAFDEANKPVEEVVEDEDRE